MDDGGRVPESGLSAEVGVPFVVAEQQVAGGGLGLLVIALFAYWKAYLPRVLRVALWLLGGRDYAERKLVAAHRTLPFGSIVRVTNVKNGRSVTVQIIDRGPYGKNYREGTIIDLSKAAARQLRMLRDGQVHVRVVVLSIGDGKRVDRASDS